MILCKTFVFENIFLKIEDKIEFLFRNLCSFTKLKHITVHAYKSLEIDIEIYLRHRGTSLVSMFKTSPMLHVKPRVMDDFKALRGGH